MVSWKLGMSGLTPSQKKKLLRVTRLFQSQIPTPGLDNQSSSDSRGGLGYHYRPVKPFNSSMGARQWGGGQGTSVLIGPAGKTSVT